MAKTYVDQVYSGVLTTIESTIATISVGNTFIIKGIWISNSNSSDQTVTLKIDDKRLIPTRAIPKNDTLIMSDLNIALTAGKTIKVTGAVNSDIDYYIWGVNEAVI